MPAETRHYVPKLQAVKNIVARPGDFNLHAARARQPPLLPERADRARHRRRRRDQARRHAARGVPDPQSADEPAGDPGRRHAAGAAALRQRQPLRARAAAAPRPARELDRLDRAEDDEAGRGGARRRHERGRAARGQPHSGAHADQGRLDAGRAARQRAARRRLQRGRRQRDARALARGAAAAQDLAQGRAARTASPRSPSAIASARRRSPSGTTSAPGASFAPGQTIVVYTAASKARQAHADRAQPAGAGRAARRRGATRTASSGKSTSSSQTARAGKATGVRQTPVAKR